MYQRPDSLRSGPPGDLDTPDVLGMVHHGRKFHTLLWPPFQGLPQGDTRQTHITHIHWVTVVSEEEAGLKNLWKLIQHLSEYFYADSVLITSNRVGRLQWSFNDCIDLF